MAEHAHTTPIRRPEGALSAGGRRSLFAGALAVAAAPLARAAPPNAPWLETDNPAHNAFRTPYDGVMNGGRKDRLPSPDAGLIAACDEFCQAERVWLATFVHRPGWDGDSDAAEAERDRLSVLMEPILDRVCAQRASTMAGLLAIASCVAAYDQESCVDDPSDYVDERLHRALVRSVRGGVV